MASTLGSIDLASLKNLRDDVTQYFWFESDSSSAWGSGAHVTLYPESQFTNPNHANYFKGQNIIMNTDGFSIRNGGLPMMVLDNDSLDFNAVDISAGTYTTMATFGLTGATIGQTSNAHSVIDADGQRFYASDGTTQLANIGYDTGTSQSGMDIAPYYTFGVRQTTTAVYDDQTATYEIGDLCLYDDGSGYKTYVCVHDITTPEPWNANRWNYYIGNYSMAEGSGAIASGYASHAEGLYTTANGSASHAEGNSTKANDGFSHAEGFYTTANEYASHAEGCNTTASGDSSHAEGYGATARGSRGAHAQNYNTIASKRAQTALGTYNKEDIATTTTHPSGTTLYGEYAVIVGNGTLGNARSNALTVDWGGRVGINDVPSVADNDEAYIKIRHSSIDSDGTAPAETVYSNNLHSFDTDGTRIGYIESMHSTTDHIGTNFGASREVNGSMVYNSITPWIDANGGYGYSITSPNAFKKALSLGDAFSIVSMPTTAKNITISATGNVADKFSVARTGYKAIGIAGWNMNNQASGGQNVSLCVPYSMFLNNSNEFVYEIRNNASSQAKITLQANIVYIRTTY